MYLKRIKIFGFKSFADEVEFEFDQGVTAIVGPNGCGKSNVLDAFNWVLGEQSPGRLRGSEMQDMIFKGSRTRKPLGFASVELCFDNSKDMLPIDFDEVTVTRKLYRSGESEYLINNSPCRLKDIKELFLDTGIGTRAYSIMEQDNVRLILESSPVERRGIIEEAAGIRKYKEKKLEAERRLERIRQDLNEVKNIMGEVQKNIRRLKRQTGKAEKFREIKERLKYLEVSRLCQEYVNIEKQLGGEQKETGGLKDEIAKLAAEKNSFDADLTKLEAKRDELDEKLLKVNQESYQQQSQIEIVNSRVENFENSQHSLDDEITRLEGNRAYAESKIKQLEKDLAELEKVKDMKAEEELRHLDLTYSQHREKAEQYNAEIAELKSVLDTSEEELFEIRHKEVELLSKSETSDKRFNELKQKASELEKAVEDIKLELQEKSQAVQEHEKNLADKNSRIEKLRKDLNGLFSNLKEMDKEREEILTEYHRKRSQFDSGKKYLPQLVSIEEMSKKSLKGVEGPLSALLEKYFTGKELGNYYNMLGDKMAWMVAETKADALNAIKFLKDTNLPPLTFVVGELLTEPPVDSGFPDGVDSSTKKALVYLAGNLKISEGLIWHAECVVSGGGETPPRAMRLISLEKDVEKLKKALNIAEKKISELRKNKDEMEASLSKEIENRSNLLKDIAFLNGNIGQMNDIFRNKEVELDKYRNELKVFTTKEKLEKDLHDISGTMQDKRKELDKLKTGLEEKQKLTADLNEKMAGINARRSALDEIAGRRMEAIKNTLKQKENLESDLKRSLEMIADITAKKELQKKQYEEDLDNVGRFKKDKDVLLKSVGELEDEKGRLINRIREMRDLQKKVEIKQENLKNTMGELRQSEERLKERINSIAVRLKENMAVSLEDALKDYSKEAVPEEKIKELKRRLEKIGEVNLEAPKEYKKEHERFEFIKTHVDDLEKADEDLRSIIRKINKKTKDRFLETFESVNGNFSNIFTKLFEGGRAQLRLTEPDNILESGIEIEARPEGKNLTSILQLSGGESSLCAIALMFAIYEVKPTPFCLMDEVDSPLDDSNLQRFLRMLKDYTTNTQFIIITHNKLSMEMSDTFYGVTMEEFGVSKTISVKLKNTPRTATAG